jgi:multiple sugar transport system ATP-binding protein
MGMADRIAVLDLGLLQQYGTPQEIYNWPANRFVANFVGSVLMNFLPVRYAETDGRASVAVPVAGSRLIDVTDRKGAIEAQAAGGALSLAIRPESVGILPVDSDEATLRAKVALVEPLGAKDVVHLTADGHALRAVLPPGRRPRVGESVGVALDPSRVHLFDDDSGVALR